MRRFYIILATLCIILSVAFGYIPFLRQYAINFSLQIKTYYLDKKEAFTLFINDYMNQAAQIKDMRAKIEQLEADSIKYQALQMEFDNLYYSLESERHYMDPDVHLVKVLSYMTLGTYTKIWMHYSHVSDEPKIFGLVKDGYAIGIAKMVDNHLLGILNGDEDCSYSVYIGENRAPGTLRTMENGDIVIDYIPAWQSIKSGDNVTTSGLDGIFFEDVQVGTIGNIKPENGYLRAELKPYRFSNRLSYVWLIDTKIPQTTNLNANMLEHENNSEQ